jgi:1-acyl-sn-glycerol-3-phosphate acyltransferase
MPTLRAALRLTALIGLTFLTFVAWTAGLPLGLMSRPAAVRWRGRTLRGWSRGAIRLLGIELEVFGRPPEGAFLMVVNHLSYLDVPVLSSQLPAAFVAKAEVRPWPVLGLLIRAMNTVFVDRENPKSIPAALNEIDRLLADGYGVVLFPEGTSSPGFEVQRFHSSLLARAAKRELPVHFAALSYEAPPGAEPTHLSVCWWGDMTFPRHVFRLLALNRIRATVVFGDEPIRDRDRKRLADSLQAAVAGQFKPVVDLEEVCA